MGVYETRTLAPPLDTQEGRVEGKCSCFSCENVKCMVQNPWVKGGRGLVLGLIFVGCWPLRVPTLL